MSELPRARVLRVDKGGLGALLREVAGLGDVQLVGLLLDANVSVFESGGASNTMAAPWQAHPPVARHHCRLGA